MFGVGCATRGLGGVLLFLPQRVGQFFLGHPLDLLSWGDGLQAEADALPLLVNADDAQQVHLAFLDDRARVFDGVARKLRNMQQALDLSLIHI